MVLLPGSGGLAQKRGARPGWVDGWADGWADAWAGGRVDGWTDGWTDSGMQVFTEPYLAGASRRERDTFLALQVCDRGGPRFEDLG